MSPPPGTAPHPEPTALPFRRIALVLSGGGALGAYEVGVLKVVERIRLVPSLVSGVSIGAINAVAWLAAGRDVRPIEQVWLTARAESLGVQWVSLTLRVIGALTASLALLEVVLGLAGSRELSGAYWLWRKGSAHIDLVSTQLDLALWIVLALAGGLTALYARRVARDLDRRSQGVDPVGLRARLKRVALAATAVHLVVWVMGWPWPQRFSASVVLLLLLAWLASTPGHVGRWLRSLALGLMPETSGRGLWSGRARRRILERIVVQGDRRALAGPGTGLVVSALAIDTGLIGHFVSWPDPDPVFAEKLSHELGEVLPVPDANTMISAAVASSAIPGLFQPERVLGRDFVDAGGFSNQPLHVAIAHGADAMLVVLLTPSSSPALSSPPADVVSLGGRLLELANWRDLQTELRHLPASWTEAGPASRVCVVAPREPLPASLLSFDPGRAATLIALG
ncbi:MAG: patatin-like phospholipase family protein, partial [Candidatus Eisenbacteria bacterium]